MSFRALIFVGGESLPVGFDPGLAPTDVDLVVAADSGYDHAIALGWPVGLLVGDLDSISEAGLSAARASGVTIEQHPSDKDATDLELALDAAVHRGADHLRVVGGHGGRYDHLLGNTLVLASPRYRAQQIDGFLGVDRLHVVHDERRIDAPPNTLCTLLAVHGAAVGVRTEGLAWPLDGETLGPGSSRGVSNVTTGEHFTVAVEGGTVLVVCPGAPTATPSG